MSRDLCEKCREGQVYNGWPNFETWGVALILGNEARGLTEDVRVHLEDWVRLPIVGRAESLNVAVVGGVLMYMWLRASMESRGTNGE